MTIPFPASMRGVALRPVQPGDEGFLLRLYATTRADELALVPWSPEDKDAFVRMQFEAQRRHYTSTDYDGAHLCVILREREPIGRLYVLRRPDAIRIVDIALLEEHRNRGVGTALIAQLLDEGDERAVPVSAHVERFNPALELYGRLGFTPVGEHGAYLLVERPPRSSS